MAVPVVVLTGPVRSGKTSELARRYRAVLEGGSPGHFERALWIAPNARAAAAVRERLVQNGLVVCLQPGILTFDDLTRLILTAANSRLLWVDGPLQRDVLRRIIDRSLAAGGLSYFADAARRSGFVDLLAEHIAELKRRAIGPDAYAKHVAASLGSAELAEVRDAKSSLGETRLRGPQVELARLYADYEELLGAHDLVDRESAHQAACRALAENACRRFRQLELVVADGFTDFTRAQVDVLRLLSQHACQLFVSLPKDSTADAARDDLFAKTEDTLGELQRNFPQLEICTFAPRPLPCPAVDHIAQNIFRNPNHVPVPSANVLDSLVHMEIVEAAGAQDEIVQIARRIKARLTSPRTPQSIAKPGDVLVIFRSIADAAPRVREVFDRFGIPYYLDAAQPLIAAPLIRTLLDVLQLDQDDWPFRRLISVLTNNTIRAFDEGARRAADWLVRELQIASGRNSLLTRVRSLADDPSPPNERSEHLDRRVSAASAALPALQHLADRLDALPKQATPTQWCEALSRLGNTLAFAPSDTDQIAWQLITTHFTALEHFDRRLGEPARELSRRELLSLLRDVATHESLPRQHGEAGRVRVLSATAARNVSARHVFLAGMSEQAFPSPERPGRLASEADYRYASEAARGQPGSASPPATRAQAEMLLFYEVVSRAEESLTISYPALDDKAQTLPPSPYVVELERLFRNEAGRGIPRTTPQLSPVSKRLTPCSVADMRVQAVARAIDKEADHQLLAAVFSSEACRPLADSIDAGLRIVHARARGESFGPAEGLLASPAVAARLAQRFGPNHAWSASQWETYATCPFQFFMKEVLRLEPLSDLVVETDFARRGSRLHDVLATFHRQWLDARKQHPIAPGDEAAAFLAFLQEVANQRTSAGTRVGIDAALLELDRRQILKWANRHYDNQSKYDSGCAKLGVTMTPEYFEFRFGPSRGDSQADPGSTTDSFVIDLDGEPIHVTGQIDRIDVGTLKNGRKVFNVIDYKSGRRATLKREQLETGQQLQLPIYVEAAQVLVFKNEAEPLQAGYWGMGSGFDAKGALAVAVDDGGSQWSQTQATVRRLIRRFIDDIRHGNFPVASRDDKCTSTCDYHMLCRIAQVRSLRKTWWPDEANLKS